jgi:hypothetical protein
MAPCAALAAAVAIAACGSEDFENAPRPPSPIHLSALIKDGEVSLGPRSGVGAGLATITISNQTQDPAKLLVEGPQDNASDEVVPGGVGTMQVDLERGSYTISAADNSRAAPPETTLRVGAERKSSKNQLLLP